MDDLMKWWPLALTVVTIAGHAANWAACRKFVPRDECEKCRKGFEERMDQMDGAACDIKNRQAATPTTQALHDLQIVVERLGGEQKAFKAELRGTNELLTRVERQLALLNEHHLKGGA